MAFVNSGRDLFASVMGGDYVGYTGTSTGVTSTTLTESGGTFTANALIGHVVVTGSTYGVVLSNTGTVLTIDKWYQPASPGGGAASTPSTGVYVVLPGGQPAFWIALTENATAPANGDTTLSGELSAGGLARKVATYGHTAGATTYTLTATWTSSDATPRTINKIGVLNASSLGRLVFSTLVSSPPVLVSGDQLTVTETVTTSSS